MQRQQGREEAAVSKHCSCASPGAQHNEAEELESVWMRQYEARTRTAREKGKKNNSLSFLVSLRISEYCRRGCAFSLSERVYIIPVQPPHLSPPVCALRNLSFLSSSSFLISARVFPAIAETLNIQTPEVKDSSEIFKREL